MFNKVKERYQVWLNKTNQASPYHHVELTPTEVTPRSRVMDGDPYRQLPPRHPISARGPGEVTLTLRRIHAEMDLRNEVETAELPPPWITRQQRAYEAPLSAASRALLDEMDRMVARPVMGMRRFTDDLQGLPVGWHEWETPQYRRRHARNMAALGDDLINGVSPQEIARRIVDRARGIDGPPTGYIPVITEDMTAEEAWA